MDAFGWVQLALYVALLAALTKPLGLYLVRVLDSHDRLLLSPVFGPVERLLYRVLRVDPWHEQDWRSYTVSLLAFSLVSGLFTYVVLRFQGFLPLNPQGFGAVPPDLAFNTAASFVTNTNWQAYGGESTLSHLSQMVGLTLQNFASAAVGIAVAAALVRGIARHSTQTLGDFWADLVRINLYVLLPLSFVFALVLVSQGIVQNFRPYVEVSRLDGSGVQTIAQGPVASQVAIKILGTNGGGFMNANAAHPYENPTPLSNFLQMLTIFAIPSALTYYLGRTVKNQRHGWAVWSAMAFLFLLGVLASWNAEATGNTRLAALGVEASGNMEGKEVRFGVFNSALFAVIATGASCGAVNAMHDSFTPLEGLVPLLNIQLGEVVEGAATVDESAITGESAPVIREAGGDRSAVTGGTRVLSDAIKVRVTSNPGESFLNRMIGLVEAAQRQKTPNEIALTILLSARTIIFLVAVMSLRFFGLYLGVPLSVTVLVALLICLIPTTIGGLLSAIGIAGIDRLVQKNVLAMSGRAAEAAGDVNVLLLDKTGTITLGDRQAVECIPAESVHPEELADAAQLASLADETPEGRSIVVFAKERGLRGRSLTELLHAQFIGITAQTRMSAVNLDGRMIRKGAADAVRRFVNREFPPGVQGAVAAIAASGGTPLVVAEPDRVLGVVHLKGIVKGGLHDRFERLRAMGIKTVMITGDNRLTAAAIAKEAGVDDYLAEAKPEEVQDFVARHTEGRDLFVFGEPRVNVLTLNLALDERR